MSHPNNIWPLAICAAFVVIFMAVKAHKNNILTCVDINELSGDDRYLVIQRAQYKITKKENVLKCVNLNTRAEVQCQVQSEMTNKGKDVDSLNSDSDCDSHSAEKCLHIVEHTGLVGVGIENVLHCADINVLSHDDRHHVVQRAQAKITKCKH